MVLDLSEAQMETTPRTDLKFASMANHVNNNREEILRDVPAMPLIEEPPPSPLELNTAAGEIGVTGNDGRIEVEEFGAMETTTAIPERSFRRIESGSAADSLDNINIINNNIAPSSSSYHPNIQHQPQRRPARTPRRPRDVSWTAAALLLMPAGLLLPHLYYSRGYVDRHNRQSCDGIVRHPSWSDMALSPSSHSAIASSTLVAAIVSLALVRCLYSSPGGGDGDDVRHRNVTRTLMLSSDLCFWLNPLSVVVMWHWLPNARSGVVLPLGFIARDVCRVRMAGSALPVFRGGRIGFSSRQVQQQHHHHHHPQMFSRGNGRSVGAGTTMASSSSSHDRKTFFRALAVAALDILSRSLRRKSFVRAASALLLLQFLCVMLWWGAVSAVLSVKVFDEDGIVTKFAHATWLAMALVAGKWATGTVARLLGFVAAGGVASWFGQQTVIMERMEAEEEMERQQQMQRQQQQQRSMQLSSSAKTLESSTSSDHDGDSPTEDNSSNAEDSMSDDPASGYSSNYAAARAALHAMPEAYRSADASAYASVMDFDEGLDDDYDEDHEGPEGEGGGGGELHHRYSSVHHASSSASNGHHQQHPSSSTVKSFLAGGCSFSFGSVAQCGLLGGLAQFLWSCVRNVDGAAFFLQRRRRGNGGDCSSSFRGMDIATADNGNNGGGGGIANPRRWKETMAIWWKRMDVAIRGFVRSHSDLAMSHVAAYYKSYQRAANDVAVLIETSGVESIIHDDITTHMCSSVGHLAAGTITLIFGMLLVAHQNSSFSSPSSTLATNKDASLLEVLLFSYVLCYTIIFTALEPLRAAIKAVYVCFAEHPSSLSQAFPLIYQRLSRISDAR